MAGQTDHGRRRARRSGARRVVLVRVGVALGGVERHGA
jgi:hypothetical protein